MRRSLRLSSPLKTKWGERIEACAEGHFVPPMFILARLALAGPDARRGLDVAEYKEQLPRLAAELLW